MRSFTRVLVGLSIIASPLAGARAAEAGTVTIQPAQSPAGFSALVAVSFFNNTTCTGTPAGTSNLPMSSAGAAFPLDAGQSARITAPATAGNGGALGLTRFNNWTSTAAFTPVNPSRAICVPGFTGVGSVTYVAHYELPRTTQAPVVCGTTTFGSFPGSPLSVGLPFSMTIGDVDKDGNMDIVSGDADADALDIFFGDGHGGLSPPLRIALPNLYNNGSSRNPINPYVLDLNGDGLNDIVVLDTNIDQISVLLAQSGGGFSISNSFMTIGSPTAAVGPRTLSMGDMNGDGISDVISGNSINRTGIVVRLGNGTGGFGSVKGRFLTFDDDPFETAIGDFNGDGKNDVVAMIDQPNGVAVYAGDGAGNLAAALKTPIAGASVMSGLAVADFNEDGIPDIAAGGDSVHVRFGNGASGFTGNLNLATPSGTLMITIADLDNDGHADVVASTGSGVSMFIGDGTGHFSAAINMPTTGNTWGLAVGDLDNDGRLDVAAGVSTFTPPDQFSSTLYLFQNTCSSNAAPTMTTSAIARQIGAAATPSAIATVGDDITPAGGLTIDVTSSDAGISVATLSNNNGTVAAFVGAACSATAGARAFTLRATDGGGLSVSRSVAVQVSDDTAPTLGAYSPLTVTEGGGGSASPAAPPADNGSVTSMSAFAPGFTGSFSVDIDSGVVTVLDAGPVGTYTVTVTAFDNCGLTVQRSFTLTVRGVATLTLSNLSATYDGAPHFATAATSPANLTGVSITYSQNNVPVASPINAGSYDLKASLTNSLYDAQPVVGTLVIAKASATIALSNLSFVYDGTAKFATAATTPSGLNTVTITYALNGANVASPTHAGSYLVNASLTNDNFDAPPADAVLSIARANAIVTVTGGTFTFDAAAHPASASTMGVNHEALGPTSIFYNGSAAAPVAAGDYAVVATFAGDTDYTPASGRKSIVILKATPIFTWPAPAAIAYGTPLGAAQLDASSSVPGTFAYAPGAGTVLAPGVATLTAAFTPADAADYNGGRISVSITVTSTRQTKEGLLAQLRALRATASDRQTARHLDDAIGDVAASLAPSLWAADGIHLGPRHGDRVFQLEKAAAGKLREVMNRRGSPTPDDTLRQLIVGFAMVDRQLAATAIGDAGNRWIGDARRDLAEGDVDLQRGKYPPAFEHYRDAWQDAQARSNHRDHDDRDR